MAICLSHGGTAIYSSSSPSDEVMIGTLGGVFTIQREDSKKWQVSRKSLEGCHVSSLMIEPSRELAFAGVHKGTVYASGDLGRTWEPRDKGITEKDIYCLNFVQNQSKVKLYTGTEPAHLFESDDLGDTWHELPTLRSVTGVSEWTFPAPPHTAHVKNITFDPGDSKTIYVCVEVGGLLRSEDGGLSWNELRGFDGDIDFPLPPGVIPKDVHRLVIPASHPRWLLASGGTGICHSRDGGMTWEHLTTPSMRIGYPDALLIHPHREELIFTAGALHNPRTWRESHVADSRVARSRDGGRNWEVLHQGLPERVRGNIEAMAMEVWNGSSALFAATTDGEIFFSDDEGDQWTTIVDGLPPISKAGHYTRLR